MEAKELELDEEEHQEEKCGEKEWLRGVCCVQIRLTVSINTHAFVVASCASVIIALHGGVPSSVLLLENEA